MTAINSQKSLSFRKSKELNLNCSVYTQTCNQDVTAFFATSSPPRLGPFFTLSPPFALLTSLLHHPSACSLTPTLLFHCPCPQPPPYPLSFSPLARSPHLLYVSLSGEEERLPRGTVVRSRCRLHWLNEEPAGRGECLCVRLCVCVSVFVSAPV